MRPGMERFVGLAICSSSRRLFSCTSAGHFRAFHLAAEPPSDSSSLTPIESRELRLPGPLQDCAFHPARDPTHFAYSGEEVPPSIWSIALAFSEPPLLSAHTDEDEQAKDEQDSENVPPMNGKARKRKRQLEAKSKARELLHGEVFRAKNVSVCDRQLVHCQLADTSSGFPAAERCSRPRATSQYHFHLLGFYLIRFVKFSKHE